jgi:hypothetical protein
MARDRIVIANCGGFWGDDPTAARRQVQGGPVDYLVMDYLAEITMAILQKQRQRNPEAGFATDFLTQLRDVLVDCVDRGIKIITNAGGVNPEACGRAVEALAAELGVADRVRVGVVVGDDLYPDLGALMEGGEGFDHLDTGEPLAQIRDQVLSANVYLGAASIVQALEMGANVVIAGRVTDTGVTLAPMIHEFGWAADDWDRLAAGIVAGHIIECGTQCTGGNFTDWETVPSFDDMGFPLIEASADGTFVVTKHPNTGGAVTVHTVSEQLLYEMSAPSYLAPDCIARFDSIQLEQVGPDRVQVTGVRGEPPPERLKVACTFADGYRIVGRMMISGPRALAKAQKAAEVFWGSAGGEERYDKAMTQFIGWNACHPPLALDEPGEVLVQVAARDRDREKLETQFAPFVVGRGLGSVPGWTIPYDQGRPRTSDVVGHWPALVSRDGPKVRVLVGGEEAVVDQSAPTTSQGSVFEPVAPAPVELATTGRNVSVPLSRICLARSGDKGDTCNVGVIARSRAVYDWIVASLTADVVKQHFKDVCRGGVDRFELPNLLAMNFLLHESLGGGGTSALQFDNQGKTYAQYLLSMVVEVDEGLLATIPQNGDRGGRP